MTNVIEVHVVPCLWIHPELLSSTEVSGKAKDSIRSFLANQKNPTFSGRILQEKIFSVSKSVIIVSP